MADNFKFRPTGELLDAEIWEDGMWEWDVYDWWHYPSANHPEFRLEREVPPAVMMAYLLVK